MASGATLGGTGTIVGPVTIQNGGLLAPGDSPGTLTVGTLTLHSGSILNYQLGTPNLAGVVSDLVNVNGNLTLAGTLNVSNAGGFGSGVYRLLNYTGSLTNDGLSLNRVPAGFTPADFVVQTVLSGQVNLMVSSSGFATQFWDGTQTVADGIVHGGAGTWDNATSNWTNANATANTSWQNGFAVFEGTARTVTLGAKIRFSGMQFLTDGYTILAPGSQTLIGAPATTIRVDQGVSATIAAPIVDGSSPAALTKTDLGTLILNGTNTYSGGTTIAAGRLQIGNGGTTGSIVGNVTDNGVLVFDRSNNVPFGGAISGTGSLVQAGSGTLILTGANSYAGGSTISAGTLQIGDGATSGSLTGSVTDNGTLVFSRSDTMNFAGTVSGSGNFQQSGTTILTANNNYTGGTAINAGTLQLGNGGTTGGVQGDVLNNGSLVFDRGNGVTFAGIISGSGNLVQTGSGTLILTADNTFSGGTNIASGSTLQLGNGGTSGSVTGNIVDNGTLIFNRSSTLAFGGVISGTGSLQQDGSGTTTLSGANTYSGGTILNAGTLTVNNAQALGLGNVVVNGGILRADPQPINVKANYTQSAAGTLQLPPVNTIP